jgi:signal transduction histidine kinase
VAAIVPALAALGISGALASREGTAREFGCWILPNARVLVTPGDEGCPLRSDDQIWKVEGRSGAAHLVDGGAGIERLVAAGEATGRVSVRRRGAEQWAQVLIREVPRSERVARVTAGGAVASGLLAIPLFLLWRSRSRAAVPFALLYSAAAVVAITAIAGRQSEWLTRAALVALISAPAIVAHLSFTFPRERRVVREAPGLIAVPYALSSFLVAAGWFALDRNSLLWPTFMYLVLLLTGGAWLILILSCAFAITESTSALERARARVLCFGALALPVLPTMLWIRDSHGPTEAATAYLWVAAVVMPLPVGLAISRYNLFNLGWDVRHWVGRFVYFGAAAVVVTLVLEVSFALAGVSHPLRDPALMLLVSVACVVAVEPLRRRMLDFLEAKLTPRRSRLRDLRKSFEREIVQFHDEDALARYLGETLDRSLAPRSGCVFLSAGDEWRPAYPFGPEPPIRTTLVSAALAVLGDRRLVHLALEETEEETAADGALRAAGVDLAAAVVGGGERLGLVLLASGGTRTPYTDAEADFATTATAHAGIALRTCKLTEELLEAERTAAAGRVALAFAHDLGKEFDWMSRLVRRLPKRLEDPVRLARDVSMIKEFTDGLVGGIRKFVNDATEPARDAPGMVKCDDMVDHAVRQVGRIHGEGRITLSVDPALRARRFHEHIGRVVANLLDNALHAVEKSESVHLFATLEDGWLRIVVQDLGCGMSPEVLRKAFTPGFTTRRDQGGLGIGLSVSREIIEALGGSITLTPNPDRGTRATVRLPAWQA